MPPATFPGRLPIRNRLSRTTPRGLGSTTTKPNLLYTEVCKVLTPSHEYDSIGKTTARVSCSRLLTSPLHHSVSEKPAELELSTVRQPTVGNHRKTNTENILSTTSPRQWCCSSYGFHLIFSKLLPIGLPVRDCSIHIQGQVVGSKPIGE
jgi:hypothetical protein